MILSARPTVPPIAIIIFKRSLFCDILKIEDWRAYENMWENNDHYWPEVWFGRVDQLITYSFVIFLAPALGSVGAFSSPRFRQEISFRVQWHLLGQSAITTFCPMTTRLHDRRQNVVERRRKWIRQWNVVFRLISLYHVIDFFAGSVSDFCSEKLRQFGPPSNTRLQLILLPLKSIRLYLHKSLWLYCAMTTYIHLTLNVLHFALFSFPSQVPCNLLMPGN